MKSDCHEHSAYRQVTLPERLDAFTAEATRRAVLNQVAEDRPRLRLDASNRTYISSHGIRALMHIRNNIQDQGGAFVLENLQPFARDVLTVSGFGADLSGTAGDGTGVCRLAPQDNEK